MDDLTPGPDESLDRLNHRWSILQLRRGHRFSTDDLVCAWRAAQALPSATRLLDLGTGIGSVGLSTLHLLDNSQARLVGVEAQPISVGLARRTVRLNQLSERVEIREGDLRDASVIEAGRDFELITGSPPYMPLGKGLVSPHPQRAACRAELRGSVADYCEAARRWLAPGGRFCVVMPTADERVEASLEASGLTILERFAVYFRADRAPLISVWTAARTEDGPHPDPTSGSLIVRDADGEWTDEYYRFRANFGEEYGRSPSGSQPPPV